MACKHSRRKKFRLVAALVLPACFLFFFSGCALFPTPEQPGEPYGAPFDPGAVMVDPRTGVEIVSDQLLVRFEHHLSQNRRATMFREFDCAVVGEIPFLDIYQLRIPAGVSPVDLTTRFQASPHVQWAEVNHIVHSTSLIGYKDLRPEANPYEDPGFEKQWALHNTGSTGGTPGADIDAAEAWRIENGVPAVCIAILDTGVNYRHEDLRDNLRMPTGVLFDLIENDDDPSDERGHGTQMAGVAVGRMNGKGIVGVAPEATFLPIRVIGRGEEGKGEEFAVSLGILYAYNHGKAKIINMSFTASSDTYALRDTVRVLTRNDDVLLVASAGNYDRSTEAYPAALPGVIAVAATDHDDKRSVWLFPKAPASNYGDWVDISAPGGSADGIRSDERAIWSTSYTKNNSYGWTGGTSSAAAFVSGVGALIWSLDRRSDGDFDLSASDVREIILSTADPIDNKNQGFEGKLGTGRVNACKALLETQKQLGIEATQRSFYAESSNNLYIIDVSPQGQDTLVGTFKTPGGGTPNITDIAWENDSCMLYGVSFETLYRIDPVACVAEAVGAKLGVADVNALAFDASGNLYTSTDTGYLVVVDKATGRGTVVGSYGSGYESSGDLAFAPTGALFATVKEPGQSTDILVRVDLSTGKASKIGDTAYSDVFGLFFVGDQLYGVTAENLLISLDTKTGSGTLVRQLSFSAWGAQDADN